MKFVHVVSSSVLNDVLMDAIAMNPTPTDKGNRLKIYYMTQVAINPTNICHICKWRWIDAFHMNVSCETEFAQHLASREHQFIRITRQRK